MMLSHMGVGSYLSLGGGGEGGGSLPMYSVVIPMSDVVAETQVFTALAF